MRARRKQLGSDLLTTTACPIASPEQGAVGAEAPRRVRDVPHDTRNDARGQNVRVSFAAPRFERSPARDDLPTGRVFGIRDADTNARVPTRPLLTSTTLQRRRAHPATRARYVRVGEARVHASGPARRRGRRRAWRETRRCLGSRYRCHPVDVARRFRSARGVPSVRGARRQTRARTRGLGAGRPRRVRGRRGFVRLRGHRATRRRARRFRSIGFVRAFRDDGGGTRDAAART